MSLHATLALAHTRTRTHALAHTQKDTLVANTSDPNEARVKLSDAVISAQVVT